MRDPSKGLPHTRFAYVREIPSFMSTSEEDGCRFLDFEVKLCPLHLIPEVIADEKTKKWIVPLYAQLCASLFHTPADVQAQPLYDMADRLGLPRLEPNPIGLRRLDDFDFTYERHGAAGRMTTETCKLLTIPHVIADRSATRWVPPLSDQLADALFEAAPEASAQIRTMADRLGFGKIEAVPLWKEETDG